VQLYVIYFEYGNIKMIRKQENDEEKTIKVVIFNVFSDFYKY